MTRPKPTELIHGTFGWHVHIHVLIISEKDPTTTMIFHQPKQGRRRQPLPLEMTRSADFVAERWQAGLAKHGVDFLQNSGGLDWTTAKDAKALGRYVAKMQTNNKEPAEAMSAEATLGGFKKARGENRTPFQILVDLIKTGNMDDIDLWHEYEKASKGRRALVRSHGLREWAELGKELTDEEIAEQEAGDVEIAAFTFKEFKKIRDGGAAELLDVCERDGVEAALEWLDKNGITYRIPVSKEKPGAITLDTLLGL